MTPEPISREDINRWKAIVAGRHGTGLTHEPVARLLAALEAGEALAEALEGLIGYAGEVGSDWQRLQERMPMMGDCLVAETEAARAALAGWRAIVEGKDDAPKANQS